MNVKNFDQIIIKFAKKWGFAEPIKKSSMCNERMDRSSKWYCGSDAGWFTQLKRNSKLILAIVYF